MIPVEKTNKTYELLKTSWTYQTQEYFDNSTLHGVRYIKEIGRPICEKFMWFCFTSIGGVVTLIIIVSLWEKFQTNPTITGLDTDFHNWNVSFPTVSLCPENPVDEKLVNEYIANTKLSADGDKMKIYQDFITQIGGISYNNLNNFSNYEFDTVNDIQNFRKILKQVVLKCEDLFSNCTFKGEDIKCCDKLKPLLTEIGYCFSFNSKFAGPLKSNLKSKRVFQEESIHETDHKWSLSMMIKNEKNSTAEEKLDGSDVNKIRVYLHSAHDFPIIDENPQHVWDQSIKKISFSSKETYTTEGARQLSIKQRRCVFKDEINLFTSDIYTFRACMIQCHMELAKKLCNCIPYFYQLTEGFKYCDLKGLQCLGDNKAKFDDRRNCPCELGCSNTIYEVEKLDPEKKSKTLEIGFVSWPMVRYKREVLFGWVDLLVSFGGIAGLFLGFSLLSGVEIIYYFTMRAICMVYRDRKDLQRLREEYQKAEKPPLDLSLKPSFMKKDGMKTKISPILLINSKIQPIRTVSERIKVGHIDNYTDHLSRRSVNQEYLKSQKPRYSQFDFLL